MPVYISDSAFITLTLSAIETSIKYEASGLLLGYETKNAFCVENVIPYQIAERTSDSVYVHPLKRKRLTKVFTNYMKYKIIGEFHTHPEGNFKLSDDDKEYIRSSKYNLEIVVAVSKTNLTEPWRYEKGILSGTIDKYLIKIACWKVTKKSVIKQTVHCPFALGFDYSPPVPF